MVVSERNRNEVNFSGLTTNKIPKKNKNQRAKQKKKQLSPAQFNFYFFHRL